MRYGAVFRMGAGLALFWGLLSTLEAFAPAWPLMGLSLALALLTLGLWAAFPKRWLRLAAALIPVLPLAGAGTWGMAAGMGAGLLWYLVTVAGDRQELEYWQYQKRFPILGGIALILILFHLAFGLQRQSCMVFSGLCLLLGVLALRSLRMGDGADLRWTGWSLAALLLPLAGAAGAGALLLGLLGLLRPLLELLMTPFAHLLRLLTSLVNGIFQRAGQSAGIDDSFYDYTEYVPPGLAEQPNQPTGPADNPVAWRISELPWGRILLGLLILAALMAGTVLLIRLLRQSKPRVRGAGDYETGTRVGFRPGRKRRERPQSPAQRVRRTYRTYLALMQAKGLTLLRSTTSGEVLDRSRADGDHEALRQLYLLARYADDKGITEAQAQQAEALLERIRKTAVESNEQSS